MKEEKNDKQTLGQLRKVKRGDKILCSNCRCQRLTPCGCKKKGK